MLVGLMKPWCECPQHHSLQVFRLTVNNTTTSATTVFYCDPSTSKPSGHCIAHITFCTLRTFIPIAVWHLSPNDPLTLLRHANRLLETGASAPLVACSSSAAMYILARPRRKGFCRLDYIDMQLTKKHRFAIGLLLNETESVCRSLTELPYYIHLCGIMARRLIAATMSCIPIHYCNLLEAVIFSPLSMLERPSTHSTP
jgi:hypothetical protein